MLYRSLIIVLLAVASLYAQSELSKSRFIVQADLNYTKLYVSQAEHSYYSKYKQTFNGNGDFWLQFGREFRFVKGRLSLTPSIGLNRNGWSFERAGHSGSISYIVPYVSVAFGLHPGMFFIDVGMHYGRATFCFGEVDGKSSTDDDSYFSEGSTGYFAHVGIDFLDHFRAGLAWRGYGMGFENQFSRVDEVYGLGGFFAYMF